MSKELVTLLSIVLPSAVLTVGLALSVLNDAFIETKQRRQLLVICALVFVLIVQNYVELLLSTRYVYPFWRKVVCIVGYSVRPVILVLFCHLISPKRRFWLAWAAAGLNAAVYLSALFSRLAFTITYDNYFLAGPLRQFCFFVSIALLGYLLIAAFRAFRSEGRRENWILLLPPLLIIGSILLDYNVGDAEQPVTFLTVAIALGCNFTYIWLHQQFVRMHEKDLIAEQRIRIMLAQIQPHFLYNSLGAIRSTIYDDPDRAREAIDLFSEYLRHSMDSLTNDQPIPFEEEFKHVRQYLELQKLRFGDKLRVEYDLGCTSFRLPTLTLQPLVENAVTYGVRKSETGSGLITIRSREKSDCYEISVTDDGPGFLPDAASDDSERSHIGLQNVRERLAYTCGGKLAIHSVLGKGTTVTIVLPRGEKPC